MRSEAEIEEKLEELQVKMNTPPAHESWMRPRTEGMIQALSWVLDRAR